MFYKFDISLMVKEMLQIGPVFAVHCETGPISLHYAIDEYTNLTFPTNRVRLSQFGTRRYT